MPTDEASVIEPKTEQPSSGARPKAGDSTAVGAGSPPPLAEPVAAKAGAGAQPPPGAQPVATAAVVSPTALLLAIPLAALTKAIEDEMTRYAVPPAKAVSKEKSSDIVLIGTAIVGIVAGLMFILHVASSEPVNFVDGAAATALASLETLFIIALFVERAQEVYVGAWRSVNRSVLEERIRRWRWWREQTSYYPENSELRSSIEAGLAHAEEQMAEYRQITRRYVFYLGLALGVIIAAVGPRILRDVMAQVPTAGLQAWAFAASDILITGGLIGGGAEGIHRIMSVLTDVLDETRKRVKGESS